MADLYALHWNAVTHANEYTVEVNPGGSGWATLGTTSGTQYTVVNTSTAYQSNIKYRVKAKDTTGVYDDSPYSDELSITYYSITNTLTNCTSDNIQQMIADGFTYNSIITVSDGYIIGSDNWNITIGGTSDKTKGTLSSDGKTLNVAILSAKGNIVIIASAALEAPAAPTITLTGSTISWTAVTGATGYRIIATADVAKQTDTTSTSFDLSTWSDLTAGTWTVRVLSTNGTVYSDSSNTVTYVVLPQLAAPTIAMNADGKTLEITDVADATSYDVYVDGTLKTNVAKAKAKGKLVFTDATSISNYTDNAWNQATESFAGCYVKIGSLPNSLNTDWDYHTEKSATNDNGTILKKRDGTTQIIYYPKTVEIPLDAGTVCYAWRLSETTSSHLQPYFYNNSTEKTTLQTVAVEFTIAADGVYEFHSTFEANYDRCLTGDTLITMSDGSEKRIDTLRVGDKILSYNPKTGELEKDEVVYSDSTENKQHDNFDIWTFSDGTIIKTVHRHRFYNVERNAMVYMDEWKIGEHAIKMDGTKVALVNHVNVQEEVRHYTIFTNHQNYFVNGLLSGNRYTKPIIFGNDGR